MATGGERRNMGDEDKPDERVREGDFNSMEPPEEVQSEHAPRGERTRIDEDERPETSHSQAEECAESQARIVNEQQTTCSGENPLHVLKLYPDILTRTYMVPPLYFNQVPLIKKKIAGQIVHVASLSTDDDIPAHLERPLVPAADAAINDDRANIQVLRCLQKLGETRQEPMFVILSLESYSGLLLWPRRRIDERIPYSNFSVILVHRRHGVLLCVGLGQLVQDSYMLSSYLGTAVQQLRQNAGEVKDMFRDLIPTLNVRTAVILPGVTSEHLLDALSFSDHLEKEVCECLGAEDAAEASQLCLCADQLSDPSAPDTVTQDMLSQLGTWFDRRLACHVDEHMTDDVYVYMVAGLCGPKRTLYVPPMTNERVEVKTESAAVAETGERMAVPVLFPCQVHLLTSAPPLRFLTGPPGTGKSRTLYMMARTWLREGHDVHVLSTSQSSRAVSFLLTQQLQEAARDIFRDYLPRFLIWFRGIVGNMFGVGDYDLSELRIRPIINGKLPIVRVQILHAVRQMPDYLSTLTDQLLDADRQLFGDQSRYRDQLLGTVRDFMSDDQSRFSDQLEDTVRQMCDDLSRFRDQFKNTAVEILRLGQSTLTPFATQCPPRNCAEGVVWQRGLTDHLRDAIRKMFSELPRLTLQFVFIRAILLDLHKYRPIPPVLNLAMSDEQSSVILRDVIDIYGDLSRLRDQLQNTFREMSGYLSRSRQHQRYVREMCGKVPRLGDFQDAVRKVSFPTYQRQPTSIVMFDKPSASGRSYNESVRGKSDNQPAAGEYDDQPWPGQVHHHSYSFEEGEIDEAVEGLASLARDGQLRVIIDEAGPEFGDAFRSFCQNLLDRVPGLHLWAATVFHEVRPECLPEEKLTVPCRCPPTVHAEVGMCLFLNNNKIETYSKRKTPAPTDGPNVKWLAHRDQPGHGENDPQDCLKCGHNIADVLAGLVSSTWEQPDTSRVKLPRRLEYRDVFVLCPSPKDDSEVVQGLKSRGVPVRVVKKGDPDDVVRDMALGESDVVTVADGTIITGLERKIVVGVGPIGAHTYSRLLISSRCTAQLVWLRDD